MVDVAAKAETHRVARAGGTIRMRPETLTLIEIGQRQEGRRARRRPHRRDPGRQAHRRSWCRCAIRSRSRASRSSSSSIAPPASVRCTAQVETVGRTGVEMEALTAVQVGLLTIYDMCKAVDRGMVIGDVRVLEKRGGKSGDWVAAAGRRRARRGRRRC